MSDHIVSFFRDRFFGGEAATFASICVAGQTVRMPLPANKQGTFCVDHGTLRFEITMQVHEAFEAVEWQTKVTNLGDTDSPILSDIAVLDITIPVAAAETVIHKGLQGDSRTGETFLPFANKISTGQTVRYRPVSGKPSHHAFPFFDVCGEQDGVICAIGWAGTWQYAIERTDKELTIQAGLPKARFYMKPQETLVLPRILLMGYDHGYRAAHNRFRRLMRDHYSPKMRLGEKMKLPVALQNYDRYTFTNPAWNGEELQLETIRMSEKCGFCDTYWLDAAWFRKGFFGGGIGNYSFRPEFPQGLSNISALAHEKGLRMLVWFEPERVYYDTDVALAHPEYLLRSPRENHIWKPGTRWMGCDQPGMLYDMSNPEAVDWLLGVLGDFVERYDIDIFRMDFNIYPVRFWEDNDTPDRIGVTEIKYVEGVYRLLDGLLERFPRLLIDNCAGGGNRMELEACIRCVFCWRSDTGCDKESEIKRTSVWNQNQNIALSNYIVYHAIASWEPRAYDVRSAMTNGFGANFGVLDDGFDFENAKKTLAECQRLGKYWEDDVYPIIPPDLAEDHWSACQFGTAESGVVMVFRREKDQQPEQTICFQALDPEAAYLLRITDEDYRTTEVLAKGAALLDGYPLCLAQPRTSMTVEYLRQ